MSEIVKIVGVVAIIVFLAAYVGEKTISWFINPGSKMERIEEILGYVSSGAFALAAACGIINLFM